MTDKEVLKKMEYIIDFSGYRIKTQIIAAKLAFKTGLTQLIKRGGFKDCNPKLRVEANALYLELTIDESLIKKYQRDLALIGKPYALLGVKTSFEVVDE